MGKAQRNFLLPLLMMALKNISSITYWVDIALNREHEAITLPFETHKDRAVLNTASIPTKNSSIYSPLFSIFPHESFSSPVGPYFIPASWYYSLQKIGLYAKSHLSYKLTNIFLKAKKWMALLLVSWGTSTHTSFLRIIITGYPKESIHNVFWSRSWNAHLLPFSVSSL